jgi:hypothetical protein
MNLSQPTTPNFFITFKDNAYFLDDDEPRGLCCASIDLCGSPDWTSIAFVEHDEDIKDEVTEIEASLRRLHAIPKVRYLVTVGLWDRAYGGGEEGGWYYDYSIPVCSPFELDEKYQNLPVGSMEHKRFAKVRTFDDYDEACACALRWNLLLDRWVNAERRELSSVASTGRFYAHIYRNEITPTPTETPRYE